MYDTINLINIYSVEDIVKRWFYLDNYIVSKIISFYNRYANECYALAPVTINYYDLTILLEGKMTYIIDGKSYSIKKNDAVFIKPGMTRKRLYNSTPVKFISFNFLINPDIELPFDSAISGCVNSMVGKLLALYPATQKTRAFHSYEKITNILNCILFELIDTNNFKSNNEHIVKIFKYISENIDKKISLDSISKEMHLSREYISRIFKEETGKTITNYITEQKMILAKEMISTHDMSLTSVANHLGYENYHYFSRVFKKYFKVTPIVFKKTSSINS